VGLSRIGLGGVEFWAMTLLIVKSVTSLG